MDKKRALRTTLDPGAQFGKADSARKQKCVDQYYLAFSSASHYIEKQKGCQGFLFFFFLGRVGYHGHRRPQTAHSMETPRRNTTPPRISTDGLVKPTAAPHPLQYRGFSVCDCHFRTMGVVLKIVHLLYRDYVEALCIGTFPSSSVRLAQPTVDRRSASSPVR